MIEGLSKEEVMQTNRIVIFDCNDIIIQILRLSTGKYKAYANFDRIAENWYR